MPDLKPEPHALQRRAMYLYYILITCWLISLFTGGPSYGLFMAAVAVRLLFELDASANE